MFWWFILSSICIILATFFACEIYKYCFEGFDFKNWKCWVNLLIPVMLWINICMLGGYATGRLCESYADYAIDQYVMGNVEKVEVIKNGEVVDYHYKIIPTEHD